MGRVMSYPPPSHRSSTSTPRPRRPPAGETYRSSRFRTSTRSGGRHRSVLQVEQFEACDQAPRSAKPAPEWLLLLRAGLNRERAAIVVAVIALFVAALMIVVIPVITGQIG